MSEHDSMANDGGKALAEKPEAILEAARRLFIRDGYGATGMDTIAREAGVAKQTVYNHFHSKELLFAAVVRNRCDEMTGVLEDGSIRKGKPEDVLRELGWQFLQALFADNRLPLLRVLIAEAVRFPELGRIYYASGPDVAAKRLASYLDELNRNGILEIPEPRIASEQFYGMLSSHLQMRALLDVDSPAQLSQARQAACIENAVQTLLRAWRKR